MNVQLQPNFRTAERRLPFECVALVLQGGGALGAYQAGVYEALAEANINPDWVAGVSIGAINSAIIAGNETSEPGRDAAHLLAGNHHQSPARLGCCRPYRRSKRLPPARALQPA